MGNAFRLAIERKWNSAPPFEIRFEIRFERSQPVLQYHALRLAIERKWNASRLAREDTFWEAAGGTLSVGSSEERKG